MQVTRAASHVAEISRVRNFELLILSEFGDSSKYATKKATPRTVRTCFVELLCSLYVQCHLHSATTCNKTGVNRSAARAPAPQRSKAQPCPWCWCACASWAFGGRFFLRHSWLPRCLCTRRVVVAKTFPALCSPRQPLPVSKRRTSPQTRTCTCVDATFANLRVRSLVGVEGADRGSECPDGHKASQQSHGRL